MLIGDADDEEASKNLLSLKYWEVIAFKMITTDGTAGGIIRNPTASIC